MLNSPLKRQSNFTFERNVNSEHVLSLATRGPQKQLILNEYFLGHAWNAVKGEKMVPWKVFK